MHGFFSSAFGGRLLGFLPDVLLTLGQNYICFEVLRLLVGRGQLLAVGTFFFVLVRQQVRHFVCFDKIFPLISELIVLVSWVKFNT